MAAAQGPEGRSPDANRDQKPNGLDEAKRLGKMSHEERMAELAKKVEDERAKFDAEEAQREADRAAAEADRNAPPVPGSAAALAKASLERRAVAQKEEPVSADADKYNKNKGIEGSHMEDVRRMPNYREIGETALKEAEVKGQKLTDAQKAQLVLDAKLDAGSKFAERQYLEALYPNMVAHTANDTMKVVNFLNYPAIAADFGVKSLDSAHLEGLFPGVEDKVIQKGDHLLVSADRKSIKIVHVGEGLGTAASDTPVSVIAEGNIDQGAYEKLVAQAQEGKESGKGYEIGSDGRVTFSSKEALRNTKLGDMFQNPALLVNGKLVVRGGDGEYHNIVSRAGGRYSLSSARILVRNGTLVEQNIPADKKERYAQALKVLNVNIS